MTNITMAPDGTYTVGGGNFSLAGSLTATTTAHIKSSYVGGYVMCNYVWSMTSKPSAWNRFWVRMTLGWKWIDG